MSAFNETRTLQSCQEFQYIPVVTVMLSHPLWTRGDRRSASATRYTLIRIPDICGAARHMQREARDTPTVRRKSAHRYHTETCRF